nr:Os04g0462550 [Ipomoea trifida]
MCRSKFSSGDFLKRGHLICNKKLIKRRNEFLSLTLAETNLSRLVSGESVLSGLFSLGSGLELSQVSVVITLHLQIENLGVAGVSGADEFGVEELEDAVADRGDVVVVAAALLLLLDGGDDTPGGTASADHVLVGDGEEVALLNRQLLGAVCGRHNLLHELHHLLVALRLLGKLRHVHVLLACRCH